MGVFSALVSSSLLTLNALQFENISGVLARYAASILDTPPTPPSGTYDCPGDNWLSSLRGGCCWHVVVKGYWSFSAGDIAQLLPFSQDIPSLQSARLGSLISVWKWLQGKKVKCLFLLFCFVLLFVCLFVSTEVGSMNLEDC